MPTGRPSSGSASQLTRRIRTTSWVRPADNVDGDCGSWSVRACFSTSALQIDAETCTSQICTVHSRLPPWREAERYEQTRTSAQTLAGRFNPIALELGVGFSLSLSLSEVTSLALHTLCAAPSQLRLSAGSDSFATPTRKNGEQWRCPTPEASHRLPHSSLREKVQTRRRMFWLPRASTQDALSTRSRLIGYAPAAISCELLGLGCTHRQSLDGHA